MLKAIAKGMDADSGNETRGLLAAYFQIYSTIAGELGDLPFSTLDITGPTNKDQVEADETLNDEQMSTDLITAVLQDFPGLSTTIQRIDDDEFHTGVLVAYCATWLWLQRLSKSKGPMLATTDQEYDYPLSSPDPMSDLDALSMLHDSADIEADTFTPVAATDNLSSGVLEMLIRLKSAGIGSGCIQLAPDSVTRDPVLHIVGFHYTAKPDPDNGERMLDIHELTTKTELFEYATGTRPTLTMTSAGHVRFQALLSAVGDASR